MENELVLITVGAVSAAAALALLVALICFFKVFFVFSPKGPKKNYGIPEDEVYAKHRDRMIQWIEATRKMDHEDITITSFDGKRLCGKYYKCNEDGIIELLFHGYKGNAERDLSGGVGRCFALERNAIIIDQRAGGNSQGRVTTFGIKEYRDCLEWIKYACGRFGPNRKIIITGVSMGAATVLMAAGKSLPENVVCVLADCPYSSGSAIIKKVIADMGLPAKLLYPFVRLGARLFGGFDLEAYSPIEAVKKSRVPIIFIHGGKDGFVPCDMSRELYSACSSPHKKFVVIPESDHALAYPTDKKAYLDALADFQKECGF